jgi:thymidylate synthase
MAVESRGSKQKEILFYSMMIKDPTSLSINVPARRFKPSYATTEWLWYLSKSKSAGNIGKLAGIWKQIADGRDEVESNYGRYILDDVQWDYCKAEMLNDPDTRRATIAINQPFHKTGNPKDYPCTQYIQFFIRNNKLHLGVNMRSNDAVFGFCNDVFTFSLFQQLMLNDLNAELSVPLELGHYYHTAGSYHIYEIHWVMMDKIIKNYYTKVCSDGWPLLNKFKLANNITTKIVERFSLPIEEMSKDEIRDYTVNSMELIYER